jgi:hypothetical protein
MKLHLMQFSSLSCHFHGCRYKYFQQYAVLTIILSVSINMRDKVLNSYKTIGKIIVSGLSEPWQLVKNVLNHGVSTLVCWLDTGGR